ncbi:hypothetical protein, conserved [Trypanosoma brucei gambiense DAL972]|uniref:Uncharacterized protein n=2 Tax=Trypanosoma brucei TaxID=5691 RepID=D0A3V9_TRYB9|nr:hypothetical protein, conserved [Trypanosoma brucei gambiense DAL972]RHW69056.1 Sucrase/ferredoxin-like [Trypanosoma brucei equiperdum]CBH15953.1 hypothetical protein, conserved [Trypanosoma brucei gambiense DAL972]|eukprot:XP_011778217.1 hypothetical protein, conserved [Trypanosoma brucei gambiense DAL972]
MKGLACRCLSHNIKYSHLCTHLFLQLRRESVSIMNSHNAIVQRLSREALADIEGLDALKHGFEREECCGPVPAKLPGSMTLTEHLFLSSDVGAKDWESNLRNVAGYDALNSKVKELENVQLTVFHRPGPDECLLRFLYDEKLQSVIITQYSCITSGEFPWESKGSVPCDRSNDAFVFVCSHHQRDGRCGYCGTVLLELLRNAIKEKKGDGACIYVYPCSHVGGHMYAGNVLVYTKRGGICFGCIKPSDVDSLADLLVRGDGAIPDSLESRIRGKIGFTQGGLNCSVM